MPPDPNARSRASLRTKVFWSSLEKSRVVARAIEIQSERPEMAGLPLLREAITALPSSRRRKVIALSQAAWFEDGMRDEVRRRANEKIVLSDNASNSAANIRTLHDDQVEWREEHADWHSEWRVQLEVLKQILETLQAAVVLLETISDKLGSSVPSYAQAQATQAQSQAQAQAHTRRRRHTN